MKPLRPIENKPEYEELIEKALIEFWNDVFYVPILLILNKDAKELRNSEDHILDGLLSGKIQYSEGSFQGSFHSKMVKQFNLIGATFDKRTKTYNIELEKLPTYIQQNIAVAQVKFKEMHRGISNYLDGFSDAEINRRLADLELTGDYMKITSDLEKQFQKSVNSIIIQPNITPGMAANLSEEYTNTTKLHIKNWTQENIIKLREEVNKNTFEGFRSDKLLKSLQSNYGISLSKAKFLAHQETSLLTSKYREQRYKSAGVNKYKWQIRGFRTRDDHRKLQGQIFTWDTPPITNTKTGARNHPGEDYRCYCTAIAQAEF